MLRSKRTLSLLLPAAFVTLTLAAAPSLAVVTYGASAGTDTWPFTTPGNDYYGMNWDYNYQTGNNDDGGTLVAIGYFTLLTARHYTVSSTFTVPGGDTFRVTSPPPPLPPDPYQSLPPDLQVVHVVNDTNQYRPLPGFYDLYTGSFPTEEQSFVIVGTGDTGSTVNEEYYTDTPGTRALRWGTNRFDRLVRRKGKDWKGVSRWSTQCIEMTYDRSPNTNQTTYECGIGVHDSGGGVFVKDGDTWKLAGINLYQIGTYPTALTGSYAASIPYYASQLYDILQDTKNIGTPLYHPDLLPGDIDLDGNVDASDYITLKENFGMTVPRFTQGDFNGDGLVGYDDLLALTTNFGYTHHPVTASPIGGSMSGGGTAMPEPGSAILLVLGAAALLRRRGGESKRRLATA